MELPIIDNEVEPLALEASDSPRSRLYDCIGVVCSCACAVHCAAMPFVIGSLPALGLTWLADEGFHQWMVGICFLLAVVAVLPGYRRHRRKLVPMLALAGVSVLATGAFAVTDDCCRLDLAEQTESEAGNVATTAENASTESSEKTLPPCCEHDESDEKFPPVLTLKKASLAADSLSEDSDTICTEKCCEHEVADANKSTQTNPDSAGNEVSEVNDGVALASIGSRVTIASVLPDWLSSSMLTMLGGFLLVSAHLLNRCCPDCAKS